ncbi:hypothetical protein P3T37_006476 [Kitasatospora sp. MAA4]|uniref:hypothetical protein n=1 Tax=Kitasatospora sp. MAA4 TaxID=3035093 RepID=UPI0024737A23|nr:hypothetical protein [Kitasatospora sp. MAA4]MDH6137045.1 hypothetical protein [Kitasatospora sp. MAA4]
MTARRLLAAAVLACAALTLTACGPDDPTAAGAAPSGSTKASEPATPTAGGTHSAKPTASTKPSGAKPSTTASPGAANCSAGAVQPGHRIIVATSVGYSTSVWMKALDTKFVCGAGVPDDGYFQGYGAPKLYTFSNEVKTTMLADMKPKSLALNDFMKLADECISSPNSLPQPYSCYGNTYDVTVNSSNVITGITELYHP